MKLSVVIPAYNEALSLPDTLTAVYDKLTASGIDHELLVVNDNSSDNTVEILEDMKGQIPTLSWVNNYPPLNGFGYAVRKGLDHFSGDCVAIVMADLSDFPEDLVLYYRTFCDKQTDCVFGNRFSKQSVVLDYPKKKLYVNRIVNKLIGFIFSVRYYDATNAFKLYSRKTIEGLKPFISPHFNLTIELSLKVIVRGYSYAVVPNSWRNRKHGVSNLKIHEMGSRYFFIVLYCLIERFFSRGDFKKKW